MWREVGKLNKQKAFSGKNPIESLHREIVRLAPESQSVSDVAVTRTTNMYLQLVLEKQFRKRYPGLSEARMLAAVGMEMLMYSPADLPEGGEYKDFHVYIRSDRGEGEIQ